MAFDQEQRRGKGGKRTSSSQKVGVKCPLCGQGDVCENPKAFGCSRWREGCKFTLWKDAVTRNGGPALTAPIVKALLGSEQKMIRGSTGVLGYQNGVLGFTPKKD